MVALFTKMFIPVGEAQTAFEALYKIAQGASEDVQVYFNRVEALHSTATFKKKFSGDMVSVCKS